MPDMYTIEYQYLFNYRPLYFESNGKPMLSEPRPAIITTLWMGLNSLQTVALIDSGSTYSLFDYQLGVELGLDVRSGRVQRLSSLGGTVLGYAHQIELEIVEGKSKEDALKKVKMDQKLSSGEIIQLKYDPANDAHPWMKFAGMWKDDPTFYDFLKEIEAYRQELDKEWSK